MKALSSPLASPLPSCEPSPSIVTLVLSTKMSFGSSRLNPRKFTLLEGSSSNSGFPYLKTIFRNPSFSFQVSIISCFTSLILCRDNSAFLIAVFSSSFCAWIALSRIRIKAGIAFIPLSSTMGIHLAPFCSICLRNYGSRLEAYRVADRNFKRAYLQELLRRGGNNVAKAAGLAGLTPQGLRRLMSVLDIRVG